jgi:hypothetical protein
MGCAKATSGTVDRSPNAAPAQWRTRARVCGAALRPRRTTPRRPGVAPWRAAGTPSHATASDSPDPSCSGFPAPRAWSAGARISVDGVDRAELGALRDRDRQGSAPCSSPSPRPAVDQPPASACRGPSTTIGVRPADPLRIAVLVGVEVGARRAHNGATAGQHQPETEHVGARPMKIGYASDPTPDCLARTSCSRAM